MLRPYLGQLLLALAFFMPTKAANHSGSSLAQFRESL
jgi:hypothetical protein